MIKKCAAAAAVLSTFVIASCGHVDNGGASEESSSASAVKEWKAPEGLQGSIDYYSANPQGLTDELVRHFEDKTGVKVNVFSGTTGEITAKLTAEEANPKADVVYLASWSAASKLDKSDALLEYRPEGADAVDQKWVSPHGTFTGRDGSALTLVSNTNVVADTPKDWEDLADAKYKDQVIMPDPRESGTAADLITAMMSNWGKDKTWEYFDRLFDNGMIVQGANGPALDQVTSGSRGVILGGVDYSAYSAKNKGESLEVTIPASGTTVTPRPVMILKSTDNEAAAKAFEDFMLSEEAQAISADKNMIPANGTIAPKNSPKLGEIEQLSDDWESISSDSKSAKEEFASRYLK